jgi:N-sulfoglucosamine sulfohydrolase
MKAMVEAGANDTFITQRVNMFRYRALEEFYDLKNDPDCIHNLIDKADFQEDIDGMRKLLHDWMKRTHDILLPAFENRHSPDKLKSVLTDLYGENYTKAGKKRKRKSKKTNKKNM